MPTGLDRGSPPPSIFNDVIGPVMRGPSSSHCAAALRIGRLARDLVGGELESVLVEFHPQGSLATTHTSQGSDMGLFGGLLGWDATDPRLVASAEALRSAGIRAEIRITDFPAVHPNTYRLTLKSPSTQHQMIALSTGGGIVRVVEIDGIPLSLDGDRFSTLVFLETSEPGDFLKGGGGPEIGQREAGEEGGLAGAPGVGSVSRRDRGAEDRGVGSLPDNRKDRGAEESPESLGVDRIVVHSAEGRHILQIDTSGGPNLKALGEFLSRHGIRDPDGGGPEVRTLKPVMPIQSRPGMELPFLSAKELEEILEARGGEVVAREEDTPPHGQGKSLWEWAVDYEAARGGISRDEVLDRMEEIVRVMEGSVGEGLAGTEYQDRILKEQTGAFRERMEAGDLLDAGVLNRMILYVSAIMETKSSMGVIVAAPTAGSAGGLPGTVLGAGHEGDHSARDMAKALLAAGLVGVFITGQSTFAAEECGCQAECGAGSGMAAAALVTLMGGSATSALAAASMALQNTLGMVCDPVANRVEVPCLGRNVLAASNALASANLALAGFDPVVPLDEVIQTMDDVGKALPRELRCTALGGLSITETSKRIQIELERNRGRPG